MNFLLIWTLLFVFGIGDGTQASSDLEALYQPQIPLHNVQQEIDFWNSKFNSNPNGYIYLKKMAKAESSAFALNGKIEHLITAEDHLRNALNHPAKDHVPTLCALAGNYISQHRFCDALDLLMTAASLRSEKRMVELMLFDVYLELGWDDEAEETLHSIGMDRNFDYLIRRAKWEDGQGKLDLAVRYLERARSLAEKSHQHSQLAWIYSNLGDFYGHQGKIDLSAESFKSALAIDPGDAHSLKGLAWIEYSHRDDPDKALELLNSILAIKSTPDLLMLKAEILAYMGQNSYSNQIKVAAVQKAMKPQYGKMYNVLMADHLVNEKQELSRAISMLETEIDERPTPELIANLSRAYWEHHDHSNALRLAKKVVGHTYEPIALMNILPVLQDDELRDEISEELKDARFELGPLKFEEVGQLVE